MPCPITGESAHSAELEELNMGAALDATCPGIGCGDDTSVTGAVKDGKTGVLTVASVGVGLIELKDSAADISGRGELPLSDEGIPFTEVTVAEVIIVHVEDTVTVRAADNPPDGESGFKPMLWLTGREMLGVVVEVVTTSTVFFSSLLSLPLTHASKLFSRSGLCRLESSLSRELSSSASGG